MLVHGVVGFAPLASVSFVLASRGDSIGGFGPEIWGLLLWVSLIVMLILSVPSTLTGIGERNHMYTNWPTSHRVKLFLSMALVFVLTTELLALWFTGTGPRVMSLLGFGIVVGNNLIVFGLSFFGLKISLGRQGFGRTSYKPDMDWDPPLDVVACVADYSGDAPKMIDVQKEKQR